MAVQQTIQESQTWLEQFQASKRADLQHLQSELSALEVRRSELTERISHDNADEGSRHELDRTDLGIGEVKERIAKLRKEVRATIIQKRQELSDTLNQQIADLQADVSVKRTEKEQIRTELLPTLERQREELVEKGQHLDAEIRRLVEEIASLSRVTIESEDLEFD